MTDTRHAHESPDGGRPSLLIRVRRKPDRARYDAAAVHAVLDAAPFSHVATVRNGRPVVLPMAHGRIAETLDPESDHYLRGLTRR